MRILRIAALLAALAAAPAANATTIVQPLPITTNPGDPTTIDWSIDLPPFGTAGTISIRWNATGPSIYAGGFLIGTLEFLFVDPNPAFPPYVDYSTLSGTVVNRPNGFDVTYSMIFPQQPYPGAPGTWYLNGSGFVSISAAWLAEYAPTSAVAYITYNTAPVPEPASWAMLLGGIGLAGYALRRRTGRVSYARA